MGEPSTLALSLAQGLSLSFTCGCLCSGGQVCRGHRDVARLIQKGIDDSFVDQSGAFRDLAHRLESSEIRVEELEQLNRQYRLKLREGGEG